jgi:hypothetical protein
MNAATGPAGNGKAQPTCSRGNDRARPAAQSWIMPRSTPPAMMPRAPSPGSAQMSARSPSTWVRIASSFRFSSRCSSRRYFGVAAHRLGFLTNAAGGQASIAVSSDTVWRAWHTRSEGRRITGISKRSDRATASLA